jgi:N-acetylglucosamine-6-phosphate deacetylase
MTDIVLANADFYCGDRIVTDKALVIRKDRLGPFVPLDDADSYGEVVDLQNSSVSPGFIDLQVNGGGDLFWNDEPSAAAAHQIWRAHLKLGTTNILPTFITGSLDRMRQASASVRQLIESNDTGVLGIHFEGPWIEPARAGVHDKQYIREPNNEDEAVYKSILPIPTLVTLAPEHAPKGAIGRLSAAGIRVWAGHTNATYDQMLSATSEGLAGATHLHNAMSPFTSREPGVVGTCLADERLKCAIIVDGYHVHIASVKATWKAKNRGDLFFVTDAMPPVGGSKKQFSIGPLEIFCRNGRCETRGGTLGGSALDMATAIRNAIQKVGIPKDEALRMATLYPARFMKLDHQYGLIKENYLANLTVFNNELDVRRVIFRGSLDS